MHREKHRRLASADQIGSELSRRARFTPGYDASCKSCNCQPILLVPPDESGCNWEIRGFTDCTPSCVTFMTPLIERMRNEYRMC